ncbi:hypothetical protein H0H87_003177 [Tephrocybe sp. NHM501043]|nr:hypothetical protein H0H87_003177 [Tephrocybe sp. NHM501043]
MVNTWLKLSAIVGIVSRLFSGVDAIRITTDPTEVANKTFTYVIVGGGTAGLAVASRLAEDSATTVLVIEAGPDAQNDTIINDPGQALVAPSMYNWQYNTTAQSVGGNVLAMTQGKVLGGSSSINGMCWTRGTIDQYDSIEQLGNPGWNFKSLFRYMKAAEFYNLPNPQQASLGATVNPKAHGFNGDVNAGFPQPYEGTVIMNDMVEAARAAIPGLVQNIDVASGTPNGAARFQYSIKPGNKTEISPDGNTRSSSANAHIYPSLQEKPNLVILTGHQATRLVWGARKGSLSRASGVQLVAAPSPNGPVGPEFEVKLAKEVIIASGAIGSPRFLELSGVGDARILEPLGISVEVDLPAVGTNLQDQALNLILYNVAADIPASDYAFINAPFAPVVAFVDIEQLLGASGARAAGKDLIQSIPARAKNIVSSGAFTNVDGMEKILRAQAESIIKYKARTIFNTHPLKEVIAAEVLPGLSSIPVNASDAQWQNFVKSGYQAVLHPIGSVPLLPRNDGGAVGPDLVVYGTANVRVVGMWFRQPY